MGDVHGCAEELESLLNTLQPGSADTLISTGDFAGKGPGVVRALDLWRGAGGTAVLGNNDLRVLEIAEGRGGREPKPEDRELLGRGDLIEWLGTWPLWLDLPDAGIVVVHGGLFPDRAVEEHDPVRDREAVLELRGVRWEDGAWRYVPKRESDPGDVFWAERWEGHQRVIYGHTPQKSGTPRADRRALGLDTGCVYGLRLTAVVIEPGEAEISEDLEPFEPATGRWRTVSVPAIRRWADPPRSFSLWGKG